MLNGTLESEIEFLSNNALLAGVSNFYMQIELLSVGENLWGLMILKLSLEHQGRFDKDLQSSIFIFRAKCHDFSVVKVKPLNKWASAIVHQW